MRVLITGAQGQLGRELQQTVPCGWVIEARDSRALDVREPRAVYRAVVESAPEVIINAAAYTAVDRAEQEQTQAFAVNAEGAAHVARAAQQEGARCIHISTDFVFRGDQACPYRPDDVPQPLSIYGASKLQGEQQVLAISHGKAVILRTAWLYSVYGHNFVKTMLGLMAERQRLAVVADQVGTPTWAKGLARAIWLAAARPELEGIHHWTDAGVASWYDFAVAIQEEALGLGLLNRAVPIQPIRSADYATPAPRPSYSVLDKTHTWAALGETARHWRQSLREMLRQLAAPAARKEVSEHEHA